MNNKTLIDVFYKMVAIRILIARFILYNSLAKGDTGLFLSLCKEKENIK